MTCASGHKCAPNQSKAHAGMEISNGVHPPVVDFDVCGAAIVRQHVLQLVRNVVRQELQRRESFQLALRLSFRVISGGTHGFTQRNKMLPHRGIMCDCCLLMRYGRAATLGWYMTTFLHKDGGQGVVKSKTIFTGPGRVSGKSPCACAGVGGLSRTAQSRLTCWYSEYSTGSDGVHTGNGVMVSSELVHAMTGDLLRRKCVSRPCS